MSLFVTNGKKEDHKAGVSMNEKTISMVLVALGIVMIYVLKTAEAVMLEIVILLVLAVMLFAADLAKVSKILFAVVAWTVMIQAWIFVMMMIIIVVSCFEGVSCTLRVSPLFLAASLVITVAFALVMLIVSIFMSKDVKNLIVSRKRNKEIMVTASAVMVASVITVLNLY
jgi:hypothetical protein